MLKRPPRRAPRRPLGLDALLAGGSIPAAERPKYFANAALGLFVLLVHPDYASGQLSRVAIDGGEADDPFDETGDADGTELADAPSAAGGPARDDNAML